ncbi:MAG: four helix bundle protein [Deltaproteobacteria bacterium]|nr:four helix bundle protein [Deltaproteobacteria bacterium]
MFGLTSQIRRSAASVPANIAEGRGRQRVKEFIQFLHIAKASLGEFETDTTIAYRIDYLSEQNF